MKNRNLTESFNNAANGILYVILHERNMKIHLVAAFITVLLGFLYRLSGLEFVIICLTIGVVIVCELFNTAMEVVVDIIVDVYHPKAKIVKDVAAGAVLVSAFISMIIAYLIFFDKVSVSLVAGIKFIKYTPMHTTVISLVITIALVLVVKAFFKKGTPFKGGMPSGHTAIASSITTAVALWTLDARLTTLFIIVLFLLAQSRYEGKIHSIIEIVMGAAMGFLVTLLLFQILLHVPAIFIQL